MKRNVFLTFLLFVFVGFNLHAQGYEVTGTVTSAEDGSALPGVSVVVQGTTIGAVTDFEGEYSITVPEDAESLMFSFVGMMTEVVEIAGQTTINVELESTSMELDEVVVTALGISREKKSLGYAVQEVGGDEINTAPETNFTASLSGKVAGVQIKAPNTMGGSANVLIRGNASITGNNQPLYVIDGVPVDNSNFSNNSDGWGGYDYGNLAMDLNPADIASVSILKGAAASALYGNRASNGVILVTTKKASGRKGIGVSVNSNFQVGSVDNSTLPLHQYEYGAGYGPYYEDATGYFFEGDVDGDGTPDLITPTSEDASWGHIFDENLMVVQWDALDPAAPNYGEKRPWVAPPEGHRMPSFFETSTRWMNNIEFEGANKDGRFRLSYTNLDEKGILPNSSIKKNTVNFSGTYNFTKKLSVSANVNYINQNTVGRYGTGYDGGNPMQSFGQWFQTNVDFERLKDYKSPYDGHQYTWNYAYWTPDSQRPIYFDNPYWVRYENFEDDQRNRLLGYATADYQFTDWLSLSFRTSVDFYQDVQNERIAVGGNAQSSFANYNRNFNESNTDLILRFKKDVNDLSFNGLVGANYRSQTMQRIQVNTVGGLLIPDFYTVSNSASPVNASEALIELTERSVFANLSVGYKDMIYLEGTGRMDQSSSLKPADDPSDYTFFYPSVALSVLLDRMGGLQDLTWLDYAKVRANYANVGAGTGAYRKVNTYDQRANWGSLGLFSQPATLQNPDLLPENTRSIELGLETFMFQNRLGLDIAVYQTNSFNQIFDVPISNASGYNRMYVNGGEIENRGLEVALYTTPVQTSNFSWSLNVNWFANRNTVVSLAEGVPTLQLMSAWDVKVNAEAGEPYGTIKGTDYVYTDGEITVDEDGYLLIGDDPLAVLGNIQPEWNAGISNVFTFGNFTVNALIDIQKGGDIYSVNSKYGYATGVYAETAGLNDKGNPKRDPVADGGGMSFGGVYEDGTPNDTYVDASQWGGYWYYGWSPTARYLFDASYVKLRELSIGYTLPQSVLGDSFIRGINVSLVGRNLWIIHKNTPTFDPEAILTSGNRQGIEQGAYPTVRTMGVNLKLNF